MSNDMFKKDQINRSDCPQCGEETKELHEGYCEQCCNENQAALDRHNHEYEYWQRLNDEERNDEIRRSYT